MVRRVRKFREEHEICLNRGPTRRYSEIAETWDEADSDGRKSPTEGSALLGSNSYRSDTSYGATIIRDDVFTQCKVLLNFH